MSPFGHFSDVTDWADDVSSGVPTVLVERQRLKRLVEMVAVAVVVRLLRLLDGLTTIHDLNEHESSPLGDLAPSEKLRAHEQRARSRAIAIFSSAYFLARPKRIAISRTKMQIMPIQPMSVQTDPSLADDRCRRLG